MRDRTQLVIGRQPVADKVCTEKLMAVKIDDQQDSAARWQ